MISRGFVIISTMGVMGILQCLLTKFSFSETYMVIKRSECGTIKVTV